MTGIDEFTRPYRSKLADAVEALDHDVLAELAMVVRQALRHPDNRRMATAAVLMQDKLPEGTSKTLGEVESLLWQRMEQGADQLPPDDRSLARPEPEPEPEPTFDPNEPPPGIPARTAEIPPELRQAVRRLNHNTLARVAVATQRAVLNGGPVNRDDAYDLIERHLPGWDEHLDSVHSAVWHRMSAEDDHETELQRAIGTLDHATVARMAMAVEEYQQSPSPVTLAQMQSLTQAYVPGDFTSDELAAALWAAMNSAGQLHPPGKYEVGPRPEPEPEPEPPFDPPEATVERRTETHLPAALRSAVSHLSRLTLTRLALQTSAARRGETGLPPLDEPFRDFPLEQVDAALWNALNGASGEDPLARLVEEIPHSDLTSLALALDRAADGDSQAQAVAEALATYWQLPPAGHDDLRRTVWQRMQRYAAENPGGDHPLHRPEPTPAEPPPPFLPDEVTDGHTPAVHIPEALERRVASFVRDDVTRFALATSAAVRGDGDGMQRLDDYDDYFGEWPLETVDAALWARLTGRTTAPDPVEAAVSQLDHRTVIDMATAADNALHSGRARDLTELQELVAQHTSLGEVDLEHLREVLWSRAMTEAREHPPGDYDPAGDGTTDTTALQAVYDPPFLPDEAPTGRTDGVSDRLRRIVEALPVGQIRRLLFDDTVEVPDVAPEDRPAFQRAVYARVQGKQPGPDPLRQAIDSLDHRTVAELAMTDDPELLRQHFGSAMAGRSTHDVTAKLWEWLSNEAAEHPAGDHPIHRPQPEPEPEPEPPTWMPPEERVERRGSSLGERVAALDHWTRARLATLVDRALTGGTAVDWDEARTAVDTSLVPGVALEDAQQTLWHRMGQEAQAHPAGDYDPLARFEPEPEPEPPAWIPGEERVERRGPTLAERVSALDHRTRTWLALLVDRAFDGGNAVEWGEARSAVDTSLMPGVAMDDARQALWHGMKQEAVTHPADDYDPLAERFDPEPYIEPAPPFMPPEEQVTPRRAPITLDDRVDRLDHQTRARLALLVDRAVLSNDRGLWAEAEHAAEEQLGSVELSDLHRALWQKMGR